MGAAPERARHRWSRRWPRKWDPHRRGRDQALLVEGVRRTQAAEVGIEELSRHVDSVIVIPEREARGGARRRRVVGKLFPPGQRAEERGRRESPRSSTCRPHQRRFPDVAHGDAEQGMAIWASAAASGVDRARIAAEQAVGLSPAGGVNLSAARGVVVNITANRSSLKRARPRR